MPESSDTRKILAAQALRAFAYGFGAVLLGSILASRGLGPVGVGIVLGSVLAGAMIGQIAVARFSEVWGRRRMYVALYVALAVAGLVFASGSPTWALVLVSLTGALSTEVVESGPFTSLEQAMLAQRIDPDRLAAGFGRYNAVATAAGALGALGAGLPARVREIWPEGPADERWFLLLTISATAGAVVAWSLSSSVEPDVRDTPRRPGLGESRPAIGRLASLFALDSFGGGFVVQSFMVYWLTTRFDASLTVLGLTFAAIGVLQTLSFLVAPLIAKRFGLLKTMVFTHLPSNFLLAAVAFAPNLQVAIGLLLARTVLSQMDVPTRQAFVMVLVPPSRRAAAAAYTNLARYSVRPVGPTLAGAAQTMAMGLPFLIAGGIKTIYDIALWRSFRDVRPDDATRPEETTP
ncbi:MAG: MFS transporter [Acidimicrobiia bacterium]